jgi:RNA polymerase sigma factor (sigma-70 family)
MPPSEQANSTSAGLARLPALSSPAVSLTNLSKWFSEDVKPYEPALRAYLLKRFPSLPDHDDVVQETYTRLLRARENGRLTYAKAFLFTAARNVAIDMFRRRRVVTHESISDVVELPVLEETPGVVETLDHQQRLEVLIEAVSALPERCRQVMMLRHLDGLSYKEIAGELGISPETVKVHMVKGVRDCVAFFREHRLLEDPAVAGLAEGVTR